jgi:hypothetical protein
MAAATCARETVGKRFAFNIEMKWPAIDAQLAIPTDKVNRGIFHPEG